MAIFNLVLKLISLLMTDIWTDCVITYSELHNDFQPLKWYYLTRSGFYVSGVQVF